MIGQHSPWTRRVARLDAAFFIHRGALAIALAEYKCTGFKTLLSIQTRLFGPVAGVERLKGDPFGFRGLKEKFRSGVYPDSDCFGAGFLDEASHAFSWTDFREMWRIYPKPEWVAESLSGCCDEDCSFI